MKTGSAERRQLAVLGASSAFFPALVHALCEVGDSLPALQIRMFGRNRERLNSVARFSERLARHAKLDLRLLPCAELRECVQDAEIVVNQMRIGGFEGRSLDERFSLEFELPGDETLGPGGLASALRSLPDVSATLVACARWSPGCLFLNLTNPMGILQSALRDLPGCEDVEFWGLCELPAVSLRVALDLVGVNSAESDYIGINHQGWFTRIEQHGLDLLPAIFQAVERDGRNSRFPIDSEVMRSCGAFPLPYLRLIYHREREAQALRARKQTRGQELGQIANELYRYYACATSADLPEALAGRSMPWLAGALVPALVARLGGPPAKLYVSEPNRGYIPWLPPQATVEKCCIVDADSVKPSPLIRSTPPEPVKDLLTALVAYEEAAAAAAMLPSRSNVIEALALHPMVGCILDAERTAALAERVIQCSGRNPTQVPAVTS